MYRFLCAHIFSAPLGKYHGVLLLDRKLRVCLACKKLPNCLPKWLYHFAFPAAVNASHPHWHLVSPVFCIPAILIGVWWYITVILICSSLRMCGVEHLFVFFLPCVCVLGESISVQIFCPFLNWVFLPFKKNWSIVDIQCCVSFRYTYCSVFKSSFYILGNSPLSHVSF